MKGFRIYENLKIRGLKIKALRFNLNIKKRKGKYGKYDV